MTATSSPPFDLKQAITSNRLRGLWKMMSGFRPTFIGANLSLAVSAASKTGSYLLLRHLIDHVLPAPDRNLLLPWVALGFIGLAGLEGSFAFLSGRLSATTAEGVTRRLRNYLYDHIQRLSFAYHAKTPTGELISRSTSDVDALRRFYSEQAVGIGRILLLFIINFTALLQLNVKLAFASIIVVPFIILASAFFFQRVSKAYEAFQEQEATLSTTLQENLTGVRVVKAFARQQYEREKFDKDNWEKYKRGRRLLLMHTFFWPISDIFCALQMIGGYFLAAIMVLNGEITVGTYLAYVGLVVWLIWPMRNLGRLIVQTSTGIVSFDRVLEIIRQDREPLDSGDYQPTGNLRGALEFKDVGFAYETDQVVLKNISFTCQPGQVVALLGATGSGKTSLVNLLPRFYDYTSGSLLLDGIELNQYPRAFLRRQIGIVEQEPFLFARSIRENIAYGVHQPVSDDQVHTAARAAAIHDVIMNFPEGYNTVLGEKGVTLSGGQKQRVTIARTLLKDPRILIFDDSTSSVDTETEAEIREALESLMHGRTTFIIAHRIQSVMDADLILVLDQGQIVQRGTHETLVTEEGIYRQIYDIQTRIEVELQNELLGAQTIHATNITQPAAD